MVDRSYMQEILSLLSSKITMKSQVKDLCYYFIRYAETDTGKGKNKGCARTFYGTDTSQSAQECFNYLCKRDSSDVKEHCLALAGPAGKTYQWAYYLLSWYDENGITMYSLKFSSSDTDNDTLEWSSSDMHAESPKNLGKG